MSERSDASIPEITAFATVAQTGSFTKAAELLGITKSNVGKAVQRLEARLGTKLFQRTTRAVRLTEDGETYLLAAQAALDGLREAETALAARKSEPSGRVRIDLPSGLGRLLLPGFQTLRERFPKLTLEVALSDRMSDAVGEGWDIVVRIGELPADSEMTVRKLCDMRLALYAAPDYLARHIPISTIADLGAHDAIVFRRPSGRLRPWTLQDGEVRRELVPNPVLVIADGQAMVDAAANCMGIAQIFDRVAAPLVQSGRLVQVLPATSVQGPPVHALIPLGQRMPSKTRAVLNHLAEQLNS